VNDSTGTHRVFVANRGEIANRIIAACDALGYQTVLGVSQADADTLPARRAGKTVVLGRAQAADSYLNAGAVVHAAVATGCTMVHPGYGFLSERPHFARLCAAEGLTFVGPMPEALEALGDKLRARALAEKLGVPVSQGGPTETPEQARALAAEIGYPVLIKAANGGGGRGMKLVHGPGELAEAWTLAAAEAEAAFGNGTVFLERYVTDAKHVEVQVLGDAHGNRVHVGERECSVQYRYQKVMEEAPCVALTDQSRKILHDSALKIAAALDYQGLGTVEFLYDTRRDELAFLEVNPRIQVEHPVTEAVSGLDLVRAQLLVAAGEKLEVTQDDIELRGHAIQARITAQDPARGFLPSPGRVTRWRPPVRGGLRLDTHVYEGYLFPPYYDALMAKLIAWGADRETARKNLEDALGDFRVEGVTTAMPLLRKICAHQDYRENTVTTHWLGDVMTSIMQEAAA